MKKNKLKILKDFESKKDILKLFKGITLISICFIIFFNIDKLLITNTILLTFMSTLVILLMECLLIVISTGSIVMGILKIISESKEHEK